MATTNKRDVPLEISVSTKGLESLRALEGEVRGLAKSGGDAAPEFERLANELNELGGQIDKLLEVRALTGEVEHLAGAQRRAADAAAEMADDFGKLQAATREATRTEKEAAAAVDLAKVTLAEKKTALENLALAYDKAGKKTAEYKTLQQEAKAAVDAAKKALAEKKIALNDAELATTRARTAEKGLEDSFKQSQAALNGANTALQRLQTALEGQRQALEQAGVAVDDLAASELRLLNAFELNAFQAQQQQAELRRLAQTNLDAAKAAEFLALAQETQRKAFERDYIQFWTRALEEADRAAADLGNNTGLEKAAADSAKLQQAADEIETWNVKVERATNLVKQFNSQKAFDDAYESSRKMRDAANYVDFWTRELEQAEAAERKLAEGARQARAALDNAFSAVGVRSIAAVRAEIEEVERGLIALANNSSISGREFDRAFRAGQERIKALNDEIRHTPGELNKTNFAVTALRNAFAQLAAVYGGIELGTAFFDANQQIETLRRSMALITGSTAAAQDQIELLQKVADNAGQSVGLLAQDFTTFTAAMSMSGVALEDTNETFTKVTNAAGQLGLSTQRVGLILNALGQMASKGTVSMEELRGQLGESLPGAMNIVAQGLGVTTQRLVQMVESGNLAAKDMLPALNRGLDITFGEGTKKVDSFFAAWNRFKNALTQVAQQANDTAAFRAMASALDFLASNMSTVVDGAYALAKAFVALKAVQIVREFTGWGTAVRIAQVEQANLTRTTQVATTATVAHTAATVADTAATNANTAAKQGAALAWGTLSNQSLGYVKGAREAAASTGALATAMSALRGAGSAALGMIGGWPGALVLTAVNARDLGTAIGEGTAKLLGFGKQLEENERQFEAQNAALQRDIATRKAWTRETAEAEKRALGLNEAAARSVDAFDEVIKKGGSVEEALKKVRDSFDFGTLQGIRNAGAALDGLALQGKISAEAVKDSWAAALNGLDLGVFRTNAVAAFQLAQMELAKLRAAGDNSAEGIQRLNRAIAESEAASRRMGQALDAVAEESLRRVGSSVQEIETGFSKAFNSAINDVDILIETLEKLNANATDTADTLKTGLDVALQAANTEKAINAVIDRYIALGKAGKIAGQDVADGMRMAYEKLDQLKIGVNSVAEALKNFGLKTRGELLQTADTLKTSWNEIKNSTLVGLDQKIIAFGKYREAAIAANGGVESSEVALQRRILEMQASVKGLGDLFKSEMEKSAAAVQKVVDNFDKVLDAREKLIGKGLSGIPVRQLDQTPWEKNKNVTDATLESWVQVGNRLPPGYRYKVPGRPDLGVVKDTSGSGMLGSNGFPEGWGQGGFGTGFGGGTVNLQINGGTKTPVNVATPQDAAALTGFMSQLEQAARNAGM